MHAAALLFLFLASAAPPLDRDPPDDEEASDETPCAEELDMLERRGRIFEAEGLTPAEVERRNAPQVRALAECRERLRARRSGVDAAAREEQEIARRAGPNATEKERAAARRQIRLERLAAKKSSTLTREERAELEEGMKEEMALTHAALDRAHARDRGFQRIVHSALACYHAARRRTLQDQMALEESLVKIGTGDKTALYALEGELRHSETVLARCSDIARESPLGLEPCDTQRMALLAHCVGVQAEGKPRLSACETEDVQQYIRLAK